MNYFDLNPYRDRIDKPFHSNIGNYSSDDEKKRKKSSSKRKSSADIGLKEEHDKKKKRSKTDPENDKKDKSENRHKSRKERKNSDEKKSKKNESKSKVKDGSSKRSSNDKKKNSIAGLDMNLFSDIDFMGMDAFSIGDDPYKLKNNAPNQEQKTASWLSKIKVKRDIDPQMDQIHNEVTGNKQEENKKIFSDTQNLAPSRRGAIVNSTTNNALELASKLMNKKASSSKQQKVVSKEPKNESLEDYLEDTDSETQSLHSQSKSKADTRFDIKGNKSEPLVQDLVQNRTNTLNQGKDALKKNSKSKAFSPASSNSSDLNYYLGDNLSGDSDDEDDKKEYKSLSKIQTVSSLLNKYETKSDQINNNKNIVSNIKTEKVLKRTSDDSMDDDLLYFLENKSDKSSLSIKLQSIQDIQDEIPKKFIPQTYSSLQSIPKSNIEITHRRPTTIITNGKDQKSKSSSDKLSSSESSLDPFKFATYDDSGSDLSADIIDDIEDDLDKESDIESEQIGMATDIIDDLPEYSMLSEDIANKNETNDNIRESFNNSLFLTVDDLPNDYENFEYEDKISNTSSNKSSPLDNVYTLDDLSFPENISLDSSLKDELVNVKDSILEKNEQKIDISKDLQNFVTEQSNSNQQTKQANIQPALIKKSKPEVNIKEDSFENSSDNYSISFDEFKLDEYDDFDVNVDDFDVEATPQKIGDLQKSTKPIKNIVTIEDQINDKSQVHSKLSTAQTHVSSNENITTQQLQAKVSENKEVLKEIKQTEEIKLSNPTIGQSQPEMIVMETQTPYQAYQSYTPLGNGSFISSTNAFLGQILGEEYLKRKAGIQPALMAQNDMFKHQLEIVKLKMMESKLQFLNSVGITPPFRVIKEAWSESNNENPSLWNTKFDNNDPNLRNAQVSKENVNPQSMDELIYNHLAEQQRSMWERKTAKRYTTLEDTKAYMKMRREMQLTQ